MKKFLSFLLTFVMLFSLAMPAMAAEGDDSTAPTINGGTSGDVNATYDPGVVEFTGIEITQGDYRYDENTQTYTAIIPADKTSSSIDFKIVGNNLTYLTESNTLLKLKVENEEWGEVELSHVDYLKYLQTDGYYVCGVTGKAGVWEKWSYSNDGGQNWTTYAFEIKQSYSVTVEPSENGTVSADVAYALAGDTVSLTVTPETDFELEKLTVMQGETEITVADNKFVMPEGAVTVTASFKSTEKTYTVTIPESVENGTITVDPTEYTANQTVTLTVTPADGYEVDTLTVMNGETPVEVTKGENGEYTFTMPEGNVTVNVSFKKITYAINIGTYEGGSVVASVNDETVTNAAQDDTVTLTVTTTGIYQLKSITVKDANNAIVEFATTGEASGIYTFVMPASAVTVEAVFEEVRIVSADITWGSLAYTYTDADGWKNNSTEANAGIVTVENTGTVAIYTRAIYIAETKYSEIVGEFDNGVTQLAANESQSFKLTLKNKPQSILDGNKIGTVTVNISETPFDDSVAVVATDGELVYALANGASMITLKGDINVSGTLTINSDVTINLNGYSLTTPADYSKISENTNVSISGGTIAACFENYGNLTIDSCTINDPGMYSVNNKGNGTAMISNAYLNNKLLCNGGTIEVASTVTMSDNWKFAVLNDGKIICHFNPNNWLSSLCVATDNGDGTWTITKNN